MVLFTHIFLHKRAPLKPRLRQTLSTSLDFPPVQFTPGARTYSHCLPGHLWTPSSISPTPGGRWRPAGPSVCLGLETPSGQWLGCRLSGLLCSAPPTQSSSSVLSYLSLLFWLFNVEGISGPCCSILRERGSLFHFFINLLWLFLFN